MRNNYQAGQKYHYLTIISLEMKRYGKTNRKFANCVCECGNNITVLANSLGKNTKSCGCLKHKPTHNITHGLTEHPLYKVWQSIKERCYSKKCKSYKYYGARGILMDEKWVVDFQKFYTWSIDNGYQTGLTIERIDNNNGYYPTNCKYATRKEQCRNTSRNRKITAFGETKNLCDWLLDDRCLCSLTSLRYRLKNNWDTELAITTKNKKKGK